MHTRKEYNLMALDESEVRKDPLQQFSKWFKDAQHADPNTANAMTLCTVGRSGIPSARIVLLREFSHEGLGFYTNYESQKAVEIEDSPDVCLNFFWPALERQVRVNGTVVKQSVEAADQYFATRPRGNQLGAWASPQSAEVRGRAELDERYDAQEKKFGEGAIPRPPHWGGYLVQPYYFEFWQGRPSRFHDRIVYQLDGSRNWFIKRIAP